MRLYFSSPASLFALLLPVGSFSAGEPPAITRGPYLQALLSSSVKVLWLTDAPSRGRIEYQAAGGPPAVQLRPDARDHRRQIHRRL